MQGMETYVVLLRGINVGGKNKIPMAQLKTCLETEGFTDVTTYIQSGNVLLRSKLDAQATADKIEAMVSHEFKLDSGNIKVLALSRSQLQAVVDKSPKGFGDNPDEYYSDAIFLIGIGIDEVMPLFSPREGVDMVWPGDGVVYSQRLGALRTKSRLSKIIGTPAYKSMTIRSWGTTTKLLALLKAMDAAEE